MRPCAILREAIFIMGRFDTKGVGQNGSIRSVNLSMNFPFLYYQKIESL